MTGTAVYPNVGPVSGLAPLTVAFSNVVQQSAQNANDTNDAANYVWKAIDTAAAYAKYVTQGTENYTITSGSVSQINSAATIDGVTAVVGDTFLIPTAPTSNGPGTAVSNGVGSTAAGNGLYYVTGLTGGNIQVARAYTMSTLSAQTNPSGRIVHVRGGGTVNTFLSTWFVSSPTGDAAFTYGSTTLTFSNRNLYSLLNLTGDIVPTTANARNIGSAANYFAAAYANQFQLKGATPGVFSGSNNLLGPTGLANLANQQSGINNFNISTQTQLTVATTKYYVAGSGLTMPATALNGMVANKTTFVWNIVMYKDANGTGALSIIIFRGTNGTAADTADVSQSLGTMTAAADNMMVTIQLTVTTIGATGAYYWSMYPDNKAITATGFGQVTGSAATAHGSVSSVAMNTASLIFGIGFVATAGGTMPTISIPTVQANAYNMC